MADESIPESEIVPTLVEELIRECDKGNVKAVGIVFVDANGELHTKMGYTTGSKLPLIAGCSLLSWEVNRGAYQETQPRIINVYRDK